MAPRSPIRLSRRRLLAASGAALAVGAPAALAACGTAEDEDEDVSPEREAELLNVVLAQQLAVVEALDQASSSAPNELRGSVVRLHRTRQQSSSGLEKTISDLGGTPTDQPAESASQAESAVEGLGDQLEASIAATLDAIGELLPNTRQPVHRAIAEDAAVLAAIRDTLGEEPAPDAFVMGPPAMTEEAA